MARRVVREDEGEENEDLDVGPKDLVREDEEEENEDLEVALEDPSIKTSPLLDHDTRDTSALPFEPLFTLEDFHPIEY